MCFFMWHQKHSGVFMVRGVSRGTGPSTNKKKKRRITEILSNWNIYLILYYNISNVDDGYTKLQKTIHVVSVQNNLDLIYFIKSYL